MGKHRGTVHRWLADYREGGIEEIVEYGTSSGRKRAIPDWAVSSLKKQLEQAESGFQRYTQIQHWLDITLGVQAEYATVHHLTGYNPAHKQKACS